MKTTLQLALTRLKYLLGAVLITVVAPQLISNGALDWQLTLNGAMVAVGYWILTTFRDWQDPNIPNSGAQG